MFKRLNTGGSLLSAQEIRNCSSRMIDGGEVFYSTLQRLASIEDFKEAIARLSETNRVMRADEELVLRFFAIKNFRNGFKGNIEVWLDNYMAVFCFAIVCLKSTWKVMYSIRYSH